MSGRLEGKRCLVTGGSRNFGRALCLALAREGAHVAFTYHQRDEDAQETLSQLNAIGHPVLMYKGSVRQSQHVKETVADVVDKWGGIDVLINNASTIQILPIALMEEDDWDLVMETNVKGAYLFSRAVLRPMIRAKCGHILNVGAFASERNVGSPVHYVAAKAALKAFTHALANEVGRYNIKVNCLLPGLMDVGMSARIPRYHVSDYQQRAALGKLVDSTQLAEMVVWLVSDESSLMTGNMIFADNGL